MSELFSATWISNVLSTATYGNDCFYITRAKNAPKSEAKYCEDIWADDILKGGYVVGRDIEGGVPPKKITLDVLKDGLDKLKEEDEELWQMICNDDGEADLWDCYNYLQIALYGEIVYG